MKETFAGIGAVIGSLALIAVLFVGIYLFAWVWAPWQGKLEARQEIQSGSNRIAQYNKFFNACSGIQGLEGSIEELEKAYAKTTAANAFEESQRTSNVAGLKALRRQSIAQYNADATKEYTDGQFRASSLPYQISSEGKTTCNAY